MNEKITISLNDILEYLKTKHLIDDSDIQKIESYIQRKCGKSKHPWYTNILTIFISWFATIAGISFFAMLGILDTDKAGVLIVWGVSLLSTAVLLYNKSNSVFIRQISLPMSIIGQIIICAASVIFLDSFDVLPVIITALCIFTCFFYKNPFHIFISCFAAIMSVAIWLLVYNFVNWGINILLITEIIVIGFIFLRGLGKHELYSIGCSFAVALPFTLLSITLALELKGWYNFAHTKNDCSHTVMNSA